MNMNTFKNSGAVLAGVITIVALSIGTDFVLESLNIFPPPNQGLFIPWMLGFALLYRSIYAVAGGYVTAMLAPSRPMRLAIILGIIGIAVSMLGVIATWGKELSPHWYPIALIITALPCTWLGGKLKTRGLTAANAEPA